MAVGQQGADLRAPLPHLARYISLVVLDPVKLEEFVSANHRLEEVLVSRGLEPEEIRLLTTGCFEKICKYLKEAWPGPAPDDETEDGTG